MYTPQLKEKKLMDTLRGGVVLGYLHIHIVKMESLHTFIYINFFLCFWKAEEAIS